MKEKLTDLWDNYLSDKCAVLNTEEERKLTKKALELHDAANELLNSEQKTAIEAYIDALCDVNAIFAKKAFLKGCELSVSFIWETMNS